MAVGVKISLPGVNALTNTDPKNFSLFVDGSIDHILIKERLRGNQVVNAFSQQTVAHGLGYFPMTMQYVDIGSGEFIWVRGDFGTTGYSFYYSWVTTANLVMANRDSNNRTFTHVNFYDQL